MEIARFWVTLADRMDELRDAYNGETQERSRAVDVMESLTRRIDALARSLGEQLQDLQERLVALEEHKEAIHLSDRRNELLTEQHFEAQVLEPLIRRLLAVIDLADAHPGSVADGLPVRPDDCLRAAIADQLTELLAVYGVEPIDVPPGSTFVARAMVSGELRPAMSPEEIGTVALTLRRGFRRGERVIRPPRVAMYREMPAAHSARENGHDATDRY